MRVYKRAEMCKVYRPQEGVFQKFSRGGLGGIRIFDDEMQKIVMLNPVKLREIPLKITKNPRNLPKKHEIFQKIP